MTHVIAIRPEPGLTSTLETGRAMGLDMLGVPLFEIRPVDWQRPDAAAFDAILIGSANAILHGGDQLAKLTDKPVHSVGKTTADSARQAGFTVKTTGTGGLQSVLETIAPPARLLRIAGAEHVALKVPDGISIETVIAYRSAPQPLPASLINALRDPAFVLLHSAAAARHFASECERLGLDTSNIGLAALGPRIVEDLPGNWRSIHISPRPRDADLLEMVCNLCL